MVTTSTLSEQERFARILFPYALEQHSRVTSKGTRFVHYTNAEVAMKILRSKEVWMRKSSCMNDFLEIQYGLQTLSTVYHNTSAGKEFQSALNQIFDGVTGEIEKLFDGWTPHFRADTYLTCVSEHLDEEDTFGRLSMWRAYGGTTGVALILNSSVFLNPANGLGAYSSPVFYVDVPKFEKEFARIAENIRSEVDLFKGQGRKGLTRRIFHMLRVAVLSAKYPGFAEEKEWRVFYSPILETSPYLTKDIQVINDVPQPIYKIPLKDIPEVDFFGEIPNLLNRIIIGPTEYPTALLEAFRELLDQAGVKDAASQLCVSAI